MIDKSSTNPRGKASFGWYVTVHSHALHLVS